MAAPPGNPPTGYSLVHRFTVTGTRALLWLNLVGSALFLLALGVALGGLALYERLGRPLALPSLPPSLPVWAYWLMIALSLAAHEGLHGLVILAQGHRPRFGARPKRLVLYTTADDVYFSRAEYLAVLLAPLVGLSAFGLLGMLLTPAEIAAWIGITVAFNAASSLGDLWMAAVTASFPPQARFRDEEDGMSIFLPEV